MKVTLTKAFCPAGSDVDHAHKCYSRAVESKQTDQGMNTVLYEVIAAPGAGRHGPVQVTYAGQLLKLEEASRERELRIGMARHEAGSTEIRLFFVFFLFFNQFEFPFNLIL